MPTMNPDHPKTSWAAIEALVRTLPEKTNLVVPKTSLSDSPPHRRSRLGRKYGAAAQYRCHRREQNLHIKEYQDRWVIHVDRWNPHVEMIRHLMVDRGYDRFFHLADWILPSGSIHLATAVEAG